MTRNKKTAHARLHPAGEDCVLALSVICIHVLHNARPILRAWHDGESVALACGRGDHREGIDDWALAHAFHYTAHDPALGVIRTLRAGQCVVRDRVGSPWRRVSADAVLSCGLLERSGEPQHPPPVNSNRGHTSLALLPPHAS